MVWAKETPLNPFGPAGFIQAVVAMTLEAGVALAVAVAVAVVLRLALALAPVLFPSASA